VPRSRAVTIPDNEHSRKEIYLGLEKVAVAENSTHDEDGGLGKKKEQWDGELTREGRGLFIYLDGPREQRINQSKNSRALHPISVSRAPLLHVSPLGHFSPFHRFLNDSSLDFRVLITESSSPFS
jgi:hypothetical protein